jgi:hypothetical protein
MLEFPISTEAVEPPTGYVLAYFDGRDHLGENLARKVALLKAVFGFDERTGQLTKPIPPKALCQDIFRYIFFGKVRTRTLRAPNRFRERELARALRVAKREGGERVEIDPATGKISVTLAEPSGEPQVTDVDRWIAKREKNAN